MEVTVTESPAAVFVIVGVILLVAIVALIMGTGLFSRVPRPPKD